MHVRRIILALAALLVLTSARAGAVSVRDIVELSRAGLSDEVLVALIEVDGTVFSLDAQQLLELKAAGVRDRVLLAMLRNGRSSPVDTPAAQPLVPGPPAAPPVVVVEDRREAGLQRYPVLVIPVVVPVANQARSHHLAHRHRKLKGIQGIARGIPGNVHDQLGLHRPGKPVYWGWGGERRPDAWAPARRVHDDASH